MPTSSQSNWLSEIDSGKYITDIGIVLSHDSMSYKGYSPVSMLWALTQDGANLASQFAGGVRRFDMRTSTEKVDKTWFNFEHGGLQVGDDSNIAFGQLIKALAYNPSEFIAFNINPYNGDDFKKNNPGVEFWDTPAGQRVHSFFFTDGSGLSGTPRLWSDEVFNTWAPELPEEKRALLRGQPMFYTPRFGTDYPTIPTVGELRGKFVEGTDTWIDASKPEKYTHDALAKLDPTYAKDFPDGIVWNPGPSDNQTDPTRDRMDPYDTYWIYDQRALTRDFIENLMRKNNHNPSFLGMYNSNGGNIYKSIWPSHSDLWFDNYWGDRGTPNFTDLLLNGAGLTKKPPVGSIRGVFMTDFSVRENRGTTPAKVITSLQPKIDIVTGLQANSLKEGDTLKLKFQSNIPGLSVGNYGLVVSGLTDTFDKSDFRHKGARAIDGSSFAGSLSDGAILLNPGLDASLSLKLLRNDPSTEYFTLQLLDLNSGDLYGSPQIFDLI